MWKVFSIAEFIKNASTTTFVVVATTASIPLKYSTPLRGTFSYES